MRAIPGFDGYLASNDGRIWTIKSYNHRTRSTVMAPDKPVEMLYHKTKSGYYYVNFTINKKAKAMRVHALVLIAFVGPRPKGMEACHYPDADKSNNRLTNLRWDTPKENAKDKYRDLEVTLEKECRRCHDVKPRSEFYNDKKSVIDGKSRYCKNCWYIFNSSNVNYENKRRINAEYRRRKKIIESGIRS